MRRPLNDCDINIFARKNIPHFRGVFMRDTLPLKPRKYECAVVNLDSVRSHGTHWVAYKKKGTKVHYFDSYGNLPPAKELIFYLKDCEINYNYKRYQKMNSFNCGHLCLNFLINDS